jgi:hypothetical protein
MSFFIHKNNFVGGLIEKSLLPSTTEISLGSTNSKFKDLYLESDSLYLGNAKLSESGGNLVVTNSNGDTQNLGYDIKNINAHYFNYIIQAEDLAKFNVSVNIPGVILNTALIEFQDTISVKLYRNDFYNTNALIYINKIPSECKRLCGDGVGSGFRTESSVTERNPNNLESITWNSTYNNTQASLGNYILGIYGTSTAYVSPFGFTINGTRNEKLWLESVNIETVTNGTGTNLIFTFGQVVPSQGAPSATIQGNISIYGLS